MNIRQIQEARELYGIDDWGAGYFGINDEGHVVSHPTGEEHLSVSLPEVIAKLKHQGIHTPLILRFPQIIECQLERMHSAFRQAIGEFNFKGKHVGVFPFKVNQRREFIDAVVSCGQRLDYGLEVGSKTEFVAALSYPLTANSLLICNGFKDREFIDMAFLGAAMGKRVIVVVEGPDELATFIELAKDQPVVPQVGLRVRLYSKGAGKWEKSSGDSSKFGLTTTEVLNCLSMLEEANFKDRLAMLHFHIGSQITEIKRFKNAIKEASRVYAKVVKMGYSPQFLNIGGGVGVDYDGSKTSFLSSANYTMQEFANDAVYVLGDVCANEGVPYPTIVTESGRVIAAYHSVVVTDIREVQGEELLPIEADLPEYTQGEVHKSIKELKYILDNINRKNYVEFYHDAIEYQEELFTLFNLGQKPRIKRWIGFRADGQFKAGQGGQLRRQPRPGIIMQHYFHGRDRPKWAPPANCARAPRLSSTRSASFHFAMRSDRAKDPTFNCPTPHPMARCTMVTSSVSPDRALTMPAKPTSRAASQAALASVSVPR